MSRKTLINYIGKPQPSDKPQNINIHISLINGNWESTSFMRSYRTYRGIMTAYRNYKRTNSLINMTIEVNEKTGRFILQGEYI